MFDINKYSIGATAAILTSMGLIAGLTQGIDAKIGIISGLFIFAIADNISDSFSIHMYRESEGASAKEVFVSTFGNFGMRLIIVLSFACIVLVFPSNVAFAISSLWGLALLTLLSYKIARSRGRDPISSTIGHLVVALLVIAGSKLLGNYIVHLFSR